MAFQIVNIDVRKALKTFTALNRQQIIITNRMYWTLPTFHRWRFNKRLCSCLWLSSPLTLRTRTISDIFYQKIEILWVFVIFIAIIPFFFSIAFTNKVMYITDSVAHVFLISVTHFFFSTAINYTVLSISPPVSVVSVLSRNTATDGTCLVITICMPSHYIQGYSVAISTRTERKMWVWLLSASFTSGTLKQVRSASKKKISHCGLRELVWSKAQNSSVRRCIKNLEDLAILTEKSIWCYLQMWRVETTWRDAPWQRN